ncbi:MAG: hypothetical protein AB9869_34015 [Verrucomicrobiia bacterium]
MGLLKTNFAAGELKGRVGEMVIAKHKPGVKVVRKRPVRTSPPTPGEIANQERFARATAYAKSLKSDPERRAVYGIAARLAHRRAVNIAQSDCLQPPQIEKIDASEYQGRIGDLIRIKATDDFEVLRIGILIQDMAGTSIESGLATKESDTSAWWHYRATVGASVGQTLVIQATAEDRAGNATVDKIHHALTPSL